MIEIFDCTPAVADITSGAVKRPAPGQLKESPAMTKLASLGLAADLEPLPDISKRFRKLGFVHLFTSGNTLIGLNEDGTRLAIDNQAPELLWRSLIADLRDAAAQRDLTGAEIARRVEMKQENVARVFGGKYPPSLETIVRIADAIGLKIEFVPK